MNQAVDLNCDVGEGCGDDAALIPHVSSANIACGYHAGDADTMKRTVDLALEHGVAIGAHPSYRDRENFGRRDLELAASGLRSLIIDQIGELDRIAQAAGGKLTHVKPHGALYNRSARDAEAAAAIAAAVKEYDPKLLLFGLSGSISIAAGKAAGLMTASEVFADRSYRSDGSLTPRSQPGAVIENDDAAANQVMDMIRYGRVRTTDGVVIRIDADTICVHGDTPGAATFAANIRRQLELNGISIKPAHHG